VLLLLLLQLLYHPSVVVVGQSFSKCLEELRGSLQHMFRPLQMPLRM
jgi:hypothetical protein